MDMDKFLEQEGEATKSIQQSTTSSTSNLQEKTGNFQISLNEQNPDHIEQADRAVWSSILKSPEIWDRDAYQEMSTALAQWKSQKQYLKQDLNVTLQNVNAKIQQAHQLVRQKRVNELTSLMDEIMSLGFSFPQSYYKERSFVELQVAHLNYEVTKLVQQDMLNKVDHFKRKCTMAISQVPHHIVKGNVEGATKLFQEALDAYTHLPDGFLETKLSYAQQLLELYKAVSIQLTIRGLKSQMTPLSQMPLAPKPMRPETSKPLIEQNSTELQDLTTGMHHHSHKAKK